MEMKIKGMMLVLVCGLLLAGCGAKNSNDPVDQLTQNDLTQEKTVTAAPAPETGEEQENTPSETPQQEPYILTFEANTIDGEVWNSDRIADSKLTMINVWATYCNPCLSEMPDLGEIASEYDAAEFQLIGVISDVMETDKESVIDEARELIGTTKADYPHLLLNESLYMNLVGAVSGVPTTFFVDQNSELLGYVTGAQSKETWVALIDQLLGEVE